MSEFVPNLEKGFKHFIMHHFPLGTNCLPIHWMLRWTRQCCTRTVALDPNRSDSCVHYMYNSYVLLFKFKLLYDWMHWTITTPRHLVCVHALRPHVEQECAGHQAPSPCCCWTQLFQFTLACVHVIIIRVTTNGNTHVQ